MVSTRHLVGVAIAVTSVLAQTCTIEKNVDYEGNDISTTHQGDPSGCCGDCQNTPGCKAYNWDNGVCYLKSNKGQVVSALGSVSGFISTPKPTTSAQTDGACSVIKDVDFQDFDIKVLCYTK
ncbi:Aste57867_22140 [Aphanomyces stellatus]|uniref:Aste57867_22140 protein n=1 Tax=Aphanomyces stellatus TaxID=120398 RepID=A0A485LJE6_9STRA|nr:hypothetical protein As57867_022071 [Aphanomyces stellatus]VFT98808.1 Aste57867_22140 [Aphanomyces stellatus]